MKVRKKRGKVNTRALVRDIGEEIGGGKDVGKYQKENNCKQNVRKE